MDRPGWPGGRPALAVGVLLAMALIGCGTVETTVTPPLPSFAAPALDPLPLQVAYRFADDLDAPRVHRVGSSENPTAVHHFELGAASRATFDRILPALFAEAVPAAGATGAHGTIVIALTAAHGQLMPTPGYAAVSYTLTFVEPDGSIAGTWQVQGRSNRNGTLADETARAMRDAAVTVATEIGKQPAIVEWLKRAADGRDTETTAPTTRG
jgi:hypothetical protein